MKYEYKVLHYKGALEEKDLEDKMNKLSKDGWRLVKIKTVSTSHAITVGIVLFWEREVSS